MKTKTIYLHTMDGCPAEFNVDHLTFAHKRIKPAASLQQIQREQQASQRWDKAFSERIGDKSPPPRLGYVTIAVPLGRASGEAMK